MYKKIVGLIIALTLPLTFLVGCKKNTQTENFVMTENTEALDGNVKYSAKTYKDAFYSTENYSDENLQNEFKNIVKEITSEKDQDELIKLLKSYSDIQNTSLDYLKTYFEKYNTDNKDSKDITLNSNAMHEISSRLYEATLNGTKRHYNINDFYIYYKDKLLDSTSKDDNEEFENEVKMTTIKEYTLASIYKNAYDDSFISKMISLVEDEKNSAQDETVDKNKVEDKTVITPEDTVKPEINESDKDNTSTETTDKDTNNNTNNNTNDGANSNNNSTNNNTNNNNTNNSTNSNNNNNNANNNGTNDDNNKDYLELSETVKSQIYDAGVNSAIDFIGQNVNTSPSNYCREVYNALENDNPLGNNKEEGYKSFLQGFKTTLENNGIKFN
ncbi:hypothetical protein [Terrisporobacter sp.]